jgi:hypothetical protein
LESRMRNVPLCLCVVWFVMCVAYEQERQACFGSEYLLFAYQAEDEL